METRRGRGPNQGRHATESAVPGGEPADPAEDSVDRQAGVPPGWRRLRAEVGGRRRVFLLGSGKRGYREPLLRRSGALGEDPTPARSAGLHASILLMGGRAEGEQVVGCES